MKVGSLFTGYGGLDTAVGGELVWYAEIEKAACQVLAAHHPGIPNLGDITAINWADVEPVDILTGGYPCQPFSHAGNRKGKNDERHLWPYVLDAIRGIRPRYAILENVSGHLTLGFDSVLADLAEIGWAAEWGTFRASDVGAPHRRERLFIIACNPDNYGRPASERGSSLREGTAERWSHETSGNGQLEGASNPRIANTTRGTRRTRAGWGVSESQGATGFATRDSELAADTSGDGHGEQLHARGMASVEREATVGTQQRERSRRESDSRGADFWGKYAPAITRWELTIGRLAPAPTTPGRNDRPRLNPQFVEWMMGLDEGHVTGHGLSSAQELKMLGNGVVPQQARAAIAQLMERIPA